MRFSTPCSRIKYSGGDTSSSFFSVADKWPAVPNTEVAAMITPLFLMNSLREDLVMIFIVEFQVFLCCLQFAKMFAPSSAIRRPIHRSIFPLAHHRVTMQIFARSVSEIGNLRQHWFRMRSLASLPIPSTHCRAAQQLLLHHE